MGKKAKEHRKKVQKRNTKIKNEQKSFSKIKEKMLMELIQKEKEKGMFDDKNDNIIEDGTKL